MWKNIVESGRTQMTIWRMRIACWMLRATNTHSQYVTRIAFPRQHFCTKESEICVIRMLPVLFINAVSRSLLFVCHSKTRPNAAQACADTPCTTCVVRKTLLNSSAYIQTTSLENVTCCCALCFVVVL